LVTGAARELGRALTQALVRDGHFVFAAGRSLKNLKTLARELGSDQGQIVPIEMDVSQDQSVAAAFDEVSRQAQHLDGLINAAGVILEGGASLLDLSPDDLAGTINTNAIGALRTTQSFCSHLDNSQNPRIVNVSSGMSVMADKGAGTTAYRASKAAMNVISLQLHLALSPRSIRVVSVCLGWVRTGMGGAFATRYLDEGIAGILSALATGPDGPSGQFMRDGAPIP